MRYWTEAEDQVIREMYAEAAPVPEVATKLGRTEASVRNRAKHLRCMRPVGNWTAEDDAWLRARWGKVKGRQVAEELGRTYRAVKVRAQKIGARSGRERTQEEIDLVRQLYSNHTAEQVSEIVYGTKDKIVRVYRIVYDVLKIRKWPQVSQEEVDRFLELYHAGLPDRVISEQLGIDYNRIRSIRKDRLKLPRNSDHEGRRQGMQTQLKNLGVKNLGEMRAKALTQHVVSHGWPEDLRIREAQIIELLCDHGPQTARQLCERMGIRFRVGALGGGVGSRSYTAYLCKVGLAYRVDKVVADLVTGGLVSLYFPSMTAMEIRQRFLQGGLS